MICMLGVLALAGCTQDGEPMESSATAAVSSPSATSEAPPQTGTSNGVAYGVTPTSVDGFSPDGLGTWKAMRGQLQGGDPAVVRAFNDASAAVVRVQLAHAVAEAKNGTPWSFESSGQVTFRRLVVAQVITSAYYIGAQSETEAGTVVIDSRTARPVTLVDVFANETAGLRKLSEQTKIIMARDNGMTGVMADEPGNAPRRENFANWIPTTDGMELHFPPHQLRMGVPMTVTVPWAQLTTLLSPRMADIAKA